MTEEEIIDCLKTTGLNEEFVVEFYEEMELFAKLVTQKEREACAKICDQYALEDHENWAGGCAFAIRARGQG
jgi:hypothetical protein